MTCPYGLRQALSRDQAADVEADAEADGIESQVDAVAEAHGEVHEARGAEAHTQVVAVVADQLGPADDEALGLKLAPAGAAAGAGALAHHAAEDLLPAPGLHVVERGAEAQRAPEAKVRAGLEVGEMAVAGVGTLEEFRIRDAVAEPQVRERRQPANVAVEVVGPVVGPVTCAMTFARVAG